MLGESAGSVFKVGPVGLLVVPSWKGSFCAGSKIQLQKHRPMITSTQLLSFLSSDAPMEIFNTESYVWIRRDVPPSGVDHGQVGEGGGGGEGRSC